MKTNKILTYAILLSLIFIGVYIPLTFGQLSEGFGVGKYPCSVETPLLNDTYKVKTTPGVTAFRSQDIYKNYPIFSSNHMGTNNIKYWRRPTNGQCSPAEMCMGIYDAVNQSIPSSPIAPSWNNNERRVNFYN